MKKLFAALAVVALAAAPCAWDISDPRDASWLAAVFAAHVTHPATASKDEAGGLRLDVPGMARR